MASFTVIYSDAEGTKLEMKFHAEDFESANERLLGFLGARGLKPEPENPRESWLLAKDRMPTPDEWMWDDSLTLPDT